MFTDWLKSFRPSVIRGDFHRRRKSQRLVTPTLLEPRTLLSSMPVGPEFRVNTFTSSDQFSTSIAMDADGDFVIVWQSFGEDGDGYGIYAQRYNAAGAPQGSEFRVNDYTTAFQTFPSVAMDADGDFVVTWQSFDQDGSSWGIFAQRYSASGVAQGAEFPVNATTTSAQQFPGIAMDADGDFVITWTSLDASGSGVFAQRFNSMGTPQGGEFQVNTYTTSTQNLSAVAMDSAGNFVITWQSVGQDGLINESGIFAQRYNAAGVPQGGEFQVNTFTADNQADPAIAMDSAGNFLIAWESHNQEAPGYGVYAQRYNAAGVPQGGEFKVNSYSTGDQFYPSVGMDADGDFVIAWQSYAQDGSGYGTFARQYDAGGLILGNEFQVNSWTTGFQQRPAIALDTDGDFVIAWESSTGQDGSGYGIYARRYQVGQFDYLGVWRTGRFYLDSNHSDIWNGPVDDTLNPFGATTDTPLVGDWNGDGYDDIGVWRAGRFYLDANGNGIWDGPGVDWQFNFGNPTDTPLIGDWNHDGRDEIGVWRAAKFYLDLNGNRHWDGPGTDSYFTFGAVTDTPLVGDWNGDGTDDVGVRRNQYFYLDSNGSHTWNPGVDQFFPFGNASDTPIVVDWGGDGIDDIGVWRAGKFYIDATPDYMWDPLFDVVISFGATTDTPLIGYWRPKTVPGNPPAPGMLPSAISIRIDPASSTTPALAADEHILASLIAPLTKKRDG